MEKEIKVLAFWGDNNDNIDDSDDDDSNDGTALYPWSSIPSLGRRSRYLALWDKNDSDNGNDDSFYTMYPQVFQPILEKQVEVLPWRNNDNDNEDNNLKPNHCDTDDHNIVINGNKTMYLLICQLVLKEIKVALRDNDNYDIDTNDDDDGDNGSNYHNHNEN